MATARLLPLTAESEDRLDGDDQPPNTANNTALTPA